jgi:phosphopantothenoylcysteine synthetase/decarboxylase
MRRSCLLVGGAPRVQIDAVRYFTVSASGATAVALQEKLREKSQGILPVKAGELQSQSVQLLLSIDAQPAASALRYTNRAELERHLQQWILAHPDGIIVMSAAINDYQLAHVSYEKNSQMTNVEIGQKLPSLADSVTVKLRPASKVIDQLKNWGHRGPLVGFKFEDQASVVNSALALRERVQAHAVVANSLCGSVQAIVRADGVTHFATRALLLDALALLISEW